MDGAARIDEAVPAAEREAGREDRLSVGADLGDRRTLGELQPRAWLRDLVDDGAEHHERDEWPDDPDEDQDRQQADDRVPVRDHEDLGDVQDRVPELVQRVDEAHDGMLPDGGRRRRGLPFLEVAPRPGFQGVRSGSFRSVCGAASGRRFPTDGEASPGRCRRPMSHAVPAVLAPRARMAAPSSRSSVTTRMASASRVA